MMSAAMLRALAGAGGLAFCAGAPAFGEATAAAPDGFHVRHVVETAAGPAATWTTLVDVASWWSGSHTYSGDAASLALTPVAGGCWCEVWDGGSVEHGRVLTAMPGRLLRIEGGFGPLQGLGVGAVMTFEIAPKGAGATLTVDYAVTGAAASGLDAYALPVDAVLGEQIGRLAARLGPAASGAAPG